MLYIEMTIAGKLDREWSDWFDGLNIRTDCTGSTTLVGNLPDQSAVFGMINRLASLGMTLVSMTVENQDGSRKEFV